MECTRERRSRFLFCLRYLHLFIWRSGGQLQYVQYVPLCLFPFRSLLFLLCTTPESSIRAILYLFHQQLCYVLHRFLLPSTSFFRHLDKVRRVHFLSLRHQEIPACDSQPSWGVLWRQLIVGHVEVRLQRSCLLLSCRRMLFSWCIRHMRWKDGLTECILDAHLFQLRRSRSGHFRPYSCALVCVEVLMSCIRCSGKPILNASD